MAVATLAETAVHDAELARSLARGDETALRHLYERHGGVVLALATRMLGSREEAEEVLHDTFYRLWLNAARFDPDRAAVRTYLYALARNLCLSRLRARRARPLQADLDEHGPAYQVAMSTDPDPVPALLAGRALAALDEGERLLVEEAFFGGWSHSELAERHALPLGTVKSRIKRALAKMRGALEAGK
ncbi:MAG TPA: sigma-70 family RNA polymerase sigma factor [Trueperaceae bacterium]|nr:sigma-70 family RNA polymerase sigma factor [Trueperaceae bacterium]